MILEVWLFQSNDSFAQGGYNGPGIVGDFR